MIYLKNKGFTLIELIVVVAITAVLSGIITFTITQYIAKGKDSNIAGNLAILVTAGEIYYNASDNSYSTLCSSSILTNAIAQMPANPSGACSTANSAGVCCKVDDSGQSWAACATEFSDTTKAYCVDSRGIRKEICKNSCTSSITVCPSDDIANCP